MCGGFCFNYFLNRNVNRRENVAFATNVLQIPEGGDYEAQNSILKQMFNRSKNVHITTKPPLLGRCCYKPFFFTNQNNNGNSNN